jgi:hypothetical protein
MVGCDIVPGIFVSVSPESEAVFLIELGRE